MDAVHLQDTARRLARRIARPFSRRVRWRVENLVRAQLAEDVSPKLEGVRGIGEELEQVQRYVPLLLNTISSQNASSRDHERRLRMLESYLLTLDKLAELEPRVARIEDQLDALRRRLDEAESSSPPPPRSRSPRSTADSPSSGGTSPPSASDLDEEGR